MVILCWLGFLCLTPAVKKSMTRKEYEYKDYTYSIACDYEKAYQQILNKINDVNLSEQAIPAYISLVKSKDLPEVMQKLKKRKVSPPWTMESLETKDNNMLTDRNTWFLLSFAGRDQVPVIIRYMDNPDNSRTLIARARLGDRKVKDKLTIALNEAIKAENEPNEIEEIYNPEKPRVSELISALAAISEQDEVYTLFKKYIETHTVEQIRFEYKNICTLSKSTILKILNLYFDKAENEFNKTDNDARYSSLYFLHDSGGLYLDNETAERMLSLILRSSRHLGHLKDLGIEYYLTPEASDLLIKGLQSDNENIRALCVWQLRKLNYRWNDAELKKIAEDKSWKVRANLAIIDKSLINENEISEYVKLIKSM
jgi:Ni,Fe-hydrogenase III component G